MTVPTSLIECEARARAAAEEAVAIWENRNQSDRHVNDFAEEEYNDAYSSELAELWGLIDGSISNYASGRQAGQ